MAGTPITVAHGDGIGPEIMDATLQILKEAGARLDIETIEVGEKVYQRGISVGIEPSAWASLRRTRVFLKAPITTPQGGGFKSLNVTTRKTLGLYANVRPCVSYHPYVDTKHPKMDLIIVRENEEDLYAGIEHQQTNDVVQCLKLISRPLQGKDAGLVRVGGGYAVVYRAVPDGGTITQPEVRLVFVTKEGNLTRDSAGRLVTFPIAAAARDGSRIQVKLSVDGQLFVAFVDGNDAGENTLRLIRRRLDCTG